MDALSEVREALAPVASTLDADGYDLQISGDAAKVRLEVVARADACEDCLVPRDALAAVVRRQLSKKDLEPDVEVVYPEGSAAPH